MSAALLRMEFRRSVALLAFPLLLGVAWFIGRGSLPTGMLVWLDTSNAARMSVLPLIPLVGGLSAWTAIRNRRRGMGEMLAITPLPTVSRDLATWAGTALWGVAAYALYALILLALTLPNATWGAPLPGLLLVGALTIIAGSALGYAAGYYLPNLFVPPVVAIGLFAAQILPLNLIVYEMLSPVPNELVFTDVFQKVPEATLPQSLWFGGIGLVALAAIALKTRPRSPAYLSVLAASVVSAAVGAAMLAEPNPPGYEASPGGYSYAPPLPEPAPFEPVCKEGELTVCVHPAYVNILPETAEKVNEVARPLVGLPGAPTRAMQSGRVPASEEVSTGKVATFYLNVPDEGIAAAQLAQSLVTSYEADEESATTPPPPAEEPQMCQSAQSGEIPYSPTQEAQSVVAEWLVERTVHDPYGVASPQCLDSREYAERFASLDPALRRAWLRENLVELRAGGLTLKDLP